ncbi:MAG: DEAD/DEAH box helicase [Rhodanobacter sp.]
MSRPRKLSREATGEEIADAFGLTDAWQTPLILPTRYVACDAIHTDATFFLLDSPILIQGRRLGQVTVVSGRLTRATVHIELEDGTAVDVTWFGPTPELLDQLRTRRELAVLGLLTEFHGTWQIKGPELVDEDWLGRIMPVYPSKGRSHTSQDVRRAVQSASLTHGSVLAKHLRSRLEPWVSEDEVLQRIEGFASYAAIFSAVHQPATVEEGHRALMAIEQITSAVYILENAPSLTKAPRQPLQVSTGRSAAFKFQLTPDQLRAVEILAAQMRLPHATAALINGEVSSGKSAVYQSVAAGVADAGGSVAIMAPNGALADQIFKEWTATFPDISATLVTSGTKGKVGDSSISIGTTALLHRKGTKPLDLVIIDEQQKMGADNRRALCSEGTHVIEVSATPVPRTMALLRYTGMTTVQLTKGHSKKNIKTTLWSPDATRELKAGLKANLAAGQRVFVVYPAIDSKDSKDGGEGTSSIEATRQRWEALLPGRVRVLTGRVDDAEMRAGLEDLVTGRATIGIVTTAVEVGINVPNLRRVIVMEPDRFGLSALHQLRGRIAREGGDGSFDLLPTRELSDKTSKRLQILVDHTDGMSIAMADLRERGPGEVAGTKQSGRFEGMLPGRNIEVDTLEIIAPWIDMWMAGRESAVDNQQKVA